MNTTTPTTTPTPTDRCVSVVSVPGGRWPYCAAAEYAAVTRADGVVTWRKVRQLGPDFRSSAKAADYAAGAAARLGVPYYTDVRHGVAVSS